MMEIILYAADVPLVALMGSNSMRAHVITISLASSLRLLKFHGLMSLLIRLLFGIVIVTEMIRVAQGTMNPPFDWHHNQEHVENPLGDIILYIYLHSSASSYEERNPLSCTLRNCTV